MRFEAKDPDLATILRRIQREMIDLQPDFQRGEVWPTRKKQRLIDSILRKWHIPPIHLVAKPGGRFDVLDGQQRLTAIREFVDGGFRIDGAVEPFDRNIASYNKKLYRELPEDVREEFDSFSIRIFELHDYAPNEPYELFFRLNQPTSLTEAEKRNAFVGGPRNQVKELVELAASWGMTPAGLGFSNARMNYDDIVARFLVTIESADLASKVTATRVTERYRRGADFSDLTMNCAHDSLKLVLTSLLLDGADGATPRRTIRPNKATLHTWLCMAAELYHSKVSDSHRENFVSTVRFVEFSRGMKTDFEPYAPLLTLFQDRSTSRVADVTSVLLRDLIGWMVFAKDLQSPSPMSVVSRASDAWRVRDVFSADQVEDALTDYIQKNDWATRSWN